MVDHSAQSTAFLELYDQYVSRIFAFLYVRTGHRQVAEDLAGATWVKAWSAWQGKQPGSSPAWVFQIARHVLIDHQRKTPEIPLEHFDHHAAPETIMPAQQLREIQSALEQLSADQRDVILLRVWDGLSFDEISQVLGPSPAACKMRFARGVQKIQHILLPLIMLYAYAKLH